MPLENNISNLIIVTIERKLERASLTEGCKSLHSKPNEFRFPILLYRGSLYKRV